MRKQINYWATFEENLSYHIYNRSVNKENILESEEYCQLFLKKSKKLILQFFDIEAYCLMPNHFHFLARVKPITAEVLEKIKWQGTSKSQKYLSKEISYDEFLIDQFKRLFQSFANIYNKEQNRNGSVFQKKFKRILILDEFRWQHILGYIHHNPNHHNFKTNFNDWKYSSYAAYLSNESTLIARESVLERFDKNANLAKKEFIEFHQRFKLAKAMDNFYLNEK